MIRKNPDRFGSIGTVEQVFSVVSAKTFQTHKNFPGSNATLLPRFLGLCLSDSLLHSNFAYTILDWLLGTLLGSQRRCHADALYLSLELRMSYNLTCPAEEMVVGRLIFIGFGTTKYIAMPGQSLLMSDRH